LEYFQKKVVTLDFYKKKIAVSNKPIDYDESNRFVIIIDKIENNLIIYKE